MIFFFFFRSKLKLRCKNWMQLWFVNESARGLAHCTASAASLRHGRSVSIFSRDPGLWLANCRAILSSDWLMSLHQCPLRPWVTAPGPCCDPGHRGGWPGSPGPRVIGSWLLFHPSLPPFCCCLTRKYAFITQLCRVSDSMQRTSNCESKTDILETQPNRKFLPLEID